MCCNAPIARLLTLLGFNIESDEKRGVEAAVLPFIKEESLRQLVVEGMTLFLFFKYLHEKRGVDDLTFVYELLL